MTVASAASLAKPRVRESAVAGIQALRPELVFLDVQMPALLGTGVLRRLERPPFVIFTTALSEHAVSAFELGAGAGAEEGRAVASRRSPGAMQARKVERPGDPKWMPGRSSY